MKKIIILLVALVAILGIAYLKSNERNSRLNRSVTSVKSRELLFPDFDINGIKKVKIKDDKSETTLAVQNDAWVLAERSGYPVEKEKLQTALMSLKYEKIKAARRIGKDSWGKVGVNSPGGTATTGAGTLVELFDDKGSLKYSLVLGGQVTSSGGSNNDQMKMFGGSTGNRFVRISGEDTIWEIGEQLPDLVTKPDAWLAKAFIDVQKLKSVEVTAAKPEDSWKATRADESAEFTLDGAKSGEKIDAGKVTLGSLLATATFNDVQGKDKAATLLKDAVKVKVVTFEGFTYNLQAVKQAGQGGGDKYYLAVNVSADLPKERAAVKDEKPEDKKKNDEAFAADKKRLEEKLANEKKSEGWVYEVTEYTVSSLLKKRAEILAAPPKQEAPAAAANGQPTGLPDVKKMIPGLGNSVVTPALSVPASPLPTTPKTELKPAPAPDANPLPGVKPAAPAPVSEPAKAAAAPAKPVEVTTQPVEVTTKPVEAAKATEPAKPAANSSK